MLLTKWDPFETLTQLQGEIDRAFDRNLKASQNTQLNASKDSSTVNWYPVVDIHEDPEAYSFDVEAPGLNKDQFKVLVEDNTLSIRGERSQNKEEKNKNYHRIERSYGSFARSFLLPETADIEKVNAEYRNGVIHVKIAKKEVAKPKQIEVKVS